MANVTITGVCIISSIDWFCDKCINQDSQVRNAQHNCDFGYTNRNSLILFIEYYNYTRAEALKLLEEKLGYEILELLDLHHIPIEELNMKDTILKNQERMKWVHLDSWFFNLCD